MSAIRALRQVATPLVARRTLCTTTAAVPRVAGMRVASLASSQATRNIATRGFASSVTRFSQGACTSFILLVSFRRYIYIYIDILVFSGCYAVAEATGRIEL